jgi:hypothetical protein
MIYRDFSQSFKGLSAELSFLSYLFGSWHFIQWFLLSVNTSPSPILLLLLPAWVELFFPFNFEKVLFHSSVIVRASLSSSYSKILCSFLSVIFKTALIIGTFMGIASQYELRLLFIFIRVSCNGGLFLFLRMLTVFKFAWILENLLYLVLLKLSTGWFSYVFLLLTYCTWIRHPLTSSIDIEWRLSIIWRKIRFF